jgi:hypothetical protein
MNIELFPNECHQAPDILYLISKTVSFNLCLMPFFIPFYSLSSPSLSSSSSILRLHLGFGSVQLKAVATCRAGLLDDKVQQENMQCTFQDSAVVRIANG